MSTTFNPLGQLQRDIAGEPEFKKIPPDAIHEFRGVPQATELAFPEKMENRRCTDIAFAILLLLYILGMWSITLVLCLKDRLNSGMLGPLTSGERDVNGETFNQALRKIIEPKAWTITLLVMPVVGFVIMMIVFAGMRWHTKICFWVLTGINLAVLGLLCVGCWALVLLSDYEQASGYMGSAILNTIFLAIIIIILFCLRSRLPLIFVTYQEALKAIFRVPALLFTPLWTTIVFIIAFSTLLYVPIIVVLQHRIDGLVKAFIVLAVFKFYWVMPFISGSQCMVVAGSVASYYFARDKSNIRSPYCRSLYAYFRFHIGTVAGGSFIIAVISMLRSIVSGATENAIQNRNFCAACLGVCCSCCLAYLEEIVEYITRKAYIMTAIHGKSLCKSGKRAMRLLWSNLLDTIAVDQIGSLALSGCFLVILGVTTAIGVAGVKHNFVLDERSDDAAEAKLVINGIIPLVLGFFLTIVVAGEYLALISVAIQTIFLCFCEDKEINDGSRQRPYFMSQSLLNVIQKAFNDKLSQEQQAAAAAANTANKT